jgi:hypothetical protein
VRPRARVALAGLGLALAAAGVAAAVVLAAGGHDADDDARAAYLDRVSEICEAYGRRLDRVAPPDITIPASVYESVQEALPLVVAELDEVRAVEPPPSLRRQVARFLELSDATVARLRAVRAQALGREIGFRC